MVILKKITLKLFSILCLMIILNLMLIGRYSLFTITFVSLEIFELIFFLLDFRDNIPMPKVMHPPVCLRIFRCTACDESTNIIISLTSSAPTILQYSLVLCIKETSRTSFFQSSTSGSLHFQERLNLVYLFR